MGHRLLDQARRFPENIAVDYNGVRVSYGRFARAIESARRYLARLELPPGAVAALRVDNSLDAWVLALALRSLGLTTAAVSAPRLIAPLGLTDAACLVVSEAENLPGLPSVPRLIRVPPSALLGPSGDEAALAAPAMVEGGHLMHTSGTTGVVKKLLVDADSEPAHANQRVEAFGLTGDSVVNIFVWGLWTAIGYVVPLAVWGLGGTVVIRQPTGNRAAAADRPFTHAITTPSMLAELLADPAQGPWPGEPRLFVGGGALPPDLAAEALRRLTPNLMQIVASTEAGVWCVTPIERPGDVAAHTPLPKRMVQVVDESGRPLAAGEVGFIRVDTLPGVDAYCGDDETTRAWFRDGFFYSGDLGVLDEGGRLTIHGRVSDVVVVGDSKIAAETIERVIQKRFPTHSLAVFSTPSDRTTEALHVVFERERPEVGDMRMLAAAELVEFPTIHFHLADALPRNDRGKLQRFVLKQATLAIWRSENAENTG